MILIDATKRTAATGQMTTHSEKYLALGRTLTGIASARTRASLWVQAKRLALQFGLTHMIAIDAHAMALGQFGAILYTDLVGSAVESIEREPSTRNPLLVRSRNELQPYRLSELRDDPRHGRFDWLGFMPADSINGDGFVMPVFENATLQTLFVFVGERPLVNDATMVLLQTVAFAIHARLRDIKDNVPLDDKAEITTREAQCLQWLEEGNSDDEIASILGISKRTVRFHLDNLKKKYGVTRRTQVLAKRLKGNLEG
jgi:DNA-binding CsgD family transcriptional regulator